VHGEKVSQREVGNFAYSGRISWTVIDITVVGVADSTHVTIVPTRYFSINRWAPRHPEPASEIEVEMSLRLAKSIEKALSKNNS